MVLLPDGVPVVRPGARWRPSSPVRSNGFPEEAREDANGTEVLFTDSESRLIRVSGDVARIAEKVEGGRGSPRAGEGTRDMGAGGPDEVVAVVDRIVEEGPDDTGTAVDRAV